MNTQTNEINYLLALKSIQGIGHIGANKLLKHFLSAETIFNASAKALASVKLKPNIIQQITRFDFQRINRYLEWEAQDHCYIVSKESPYYPAQLAYTYSPPILLFLLGNPEILLSPQIAVVGSRNPSAQGLANTHFFCKGLCEKGFTITSGMAQGIDGEAHRAALEVQGHTIAVTGTGLNRVYPPAHRELAHSIGQVGLLVSENFPDDHYNAGSFQQRNRIIAGLSLGTLVIEAAKKSGTLITAKYAMEENREVYAMPGSIHNPLAKGCHYLIKQGAKLAETIEDIIEDLPCFNKHQLNHSTAVTRPSIDEETAQFLQLIDYDITPIDTIVIRSELTVEAVTNKLLLLELDGWIINCAGGYIRQ